MTHDTNEDPLRQLSEIAAVHARRRIPLPREAEALLLSIRLLPKELLDEARVDDGVPEEFKELVFWAERAIPDWVCNVMLQIQKMFPFPKDKIPMPKDPTECLKKIVESVNRERGFFIGALWAAAHGRNPEARPTDGNVSPAGYLSAVLENKRYRYSRACLSGFAQGLNAQFLDEEGRPTRHTLAYPVYRALLENWREVAALRSVTELHQWLRMRVPSQANTPERLARLQKLCQRVGLRFRERGRPRKKK